MTAVQRSPIEVAGDVQWVLGYLAGVVFLSRADLLSDFDPNMVVSWMNKYCAERPLDPIAVAVRTLAVELAKRHGVNIEITQ
jgi:hypothetical protein